MILQQCNSLSQAAVRCRERQNEERISATYEPARPQWSYQENYTETHQQSPKGKGTELKEIRVTKELRKPADLR